MIKKINLCGKEIEYTLQKKAVKNINLRIKSDCSVWVSANRFVSEYAIEKFLRDKEDFILRAIRKFENTDYSQKKEYFSEKEIKLFIEALCKKVYPYFEKKGIPYPEIKFRKMVSQWGNCRSKEGILTFNTNLMYTPPEGVEYVVLHEFTHFIEANHSASFYRELEKVCPQWKQCRKILKNISLR